MFVQAQTLDQPGTAVTVSVAAVEGVLKFDILLGRQEGQQVVRLKDKADRFATDARALRFGNGSLAA